MMSEKIRRFSITPLDYATIQAVFPQTKLKMFSHLQIPNLRWCKMWWINWYFFHHTGKYPGVEQTCVLDPHFLPVTNEDIIHHLLQGNKKIYLKHVVTGARLVPLAKTVVKICCWVWQVKLLSDSGKVTSLILGLNTHMHMHIPL
jgi:hypothetical protein